MNKPGRRVNRNGAVLNSVTRRAEGSLKIGQRADTVCRSCEWLKQRAAEPVIVADCNGNFQFQGNLLKQLVSDAFNALAKPWLGNDFVWCCFIWRLNLRFTW